MYPYDVTVSIHSIRLLRRTSYVGSEALRGYVRTAGEITPVSTEALSASAALRSGLLPPDKGCSGLRALMMRVPEGEPNERGSETGPL